MDLSLEKQDIKGVQISFTFIAAKMLFQSFFKALCVLGQVGAKGTLRREFNAHIVDASELLLQAGTSLG